MKNEKLADQKETYSEEKGLFLTSAWKKFFD